MIDYPFNQGETAWSNVLPQHSNKPSLEAFFKSFYGPLSLLTDNLKALRESRGLENAVGAQLDGIGTIVGVDRFVPKSVFLEFFGYVDQPAGRAYGVARYRQRDDPYATTYTLQDEDFRNLIKAKIIFNNSHGTIEEIISVCVVLFKATHVAVTRTGTAAINVAITRLSTNLDTLLPYYETFLPVSAGVSYTVTYP